MALGLAGALVTVGLLSPAAPGVVVALVMGAIAAGAVVAWRVHPAWTLSAAVLLSVMAGNWENVGVPGALAPDRLLLVMGIGAVLLRAPPIRDRPPLRLRPVHWVMALTLVWMIGSALAAGTLARGGERFELLERVGVLPFVLFLVAPVVFDTEEHRRILLGALVALGAYLGFTALMETLNIRALVFPSFINNPSLGTHVDRARGPFLEAVTNGAGLYTGLIGATIALITWRTPRARQLAAVVIVLCGGGLLFTETRSVWLAAVVSTVLTLLAIRELRYWFVPAVAAGTAVVMISLATVPGLAHAVQHRENDDRTVWDRKNLATASVNMVKAHPLLGIGVGRFVDESQDYFVESPDYPLTASGTINHNVYLTYAAEAGLVGVGLWLLAVVLGAAEALLPGPPEARVWQAAFGSFFLFYLVISAFVFAQVFPNDMLWLLAGVAVGAAGTVPRTELGH